jgi:signal peptidase
MTSTLHATGVDERNAPATPSTARSARRPGGVGRAISSILVAAVVIAGLAGFAMALLPFIGWQTVVLATGSMSPALPAGSLLIEKIVPASEIEVGDVVTLTREDRAPVTHRVIAIAPSAGLLESRELTLKGDGNDDPDPRPYVVERAGLLVTGVPWGGQVIDFLRTPLALGIITVLIAVLVLRAWWPQPDRED